MTKKEQEAVKHTYRLLGRHNDHMRGDLISLTKEQASARCFANKLERVLDDSVSDDSAKKLAELQTREEEVSKKEKEAAKKLKEAEKAVLDAAEKANEILSKANEAAKKLAKAEKKEEAK